MEQEKFNFEEFERSAIEGLRAGKKLEGCDAY